jgi:hypothetical protein
MQLQKTLLMLIISLMLGQAALASADLHIVFEESDTHHADHSRVAGDTIDGSDHAGDDCGHCCHSHSSNLLISPSDNVLALKDLNASCGFFRYALTSYMPDPAFRPPIA